MAASTDKRFVELNGDIDMDEDFLIAFEPKLCPAVPAIIKGSYICVRGMYEILTIKITKAVIEEERAAYGEVALFL